MATANTPKLAAESIAKGDITGWFNELYESASGNASVIPWADEKANPYLVEWLENNNVIGEEKKAIVIGCGLGDDAEELAKRGFKVTAFDISSTAIEWAKKRFPNSSVEYHAQDLFALPKEWLGSFDLVFECYTIQALPRSVRSKVIAKVASLLAFGGSLLVICSVWREDQIEDTIPWRLKKDELAEFTELGLSEITFEEFWDRDIPDRKRFRILYKKA